MTCPSLDAAAPSPEQPYLVAEKRLRRLARTAGLFRVQLLIRVGPPRPAGSASPTADPGGSGRCGPDQHHALLAADGGGWLASHHKATCRDEWVIGRLGRGDPSVTRCGSLRTEFFKHGVVEHAGRHPCPRRVSGGFRALRYASDVATCAGPPASDAEDVPADLSRRNKWPSRLTARRTTSLPRRKI